MPQMDPELFDRGQFQAELALKASPIAAFKKAIKQAREVLDGRFREGRDIRRLVDADGNPKRLDEIDEDTARALSGIDAVTIGNADVGVGAVLKFRVSDKIQAIKELLKLSGAYEAEKKKKGQAAKKRLALTAFFTA